MSGNPFAEPGDKLNDRQVIVTRRLEAAAGQVVSARKLEVRTLDSGSTGKLATPADDERRREEIDPLATGETLKGKF
jgi:hypothetical protein